MSETSCGSRCLPSGGPSWPSRLRALSISPLGAAGAQGTQQGPVPPSGLCTAQPDPARPVPRAAVWEWALPPAGWTEGRAGAPQGQGGARAARPQGGGEGPCGAGRLTARPPQGTLIQHLKEHLLHGDLTSSDTILYYTTVSGRWDAGGRAVLRVGPLPAPSSGLCPPGQPGARLGRRRASRPLPVALTASSTRPPAALRAGSAGPSSLTALPGSPSPLPLESPHRGAPALPGLPGRPAASRGPRPQAPGGSLEAPGHSSASGGQGRASRD